VGPSRNVLPPDSLVESAQAPLEKFRARLIGGNSLEGGTMLRQEQDHFPSRSYDDDRSAAHRKNRDTHGATVVEGRRLFSGILPPDYTQICRAGRVQQLARGEMLHLEDEPVERVSLLISGSAKIAKLGQGGARVTVRLAVPGDVLSAVDLFSSPTHCTTARVFRASQALIWDARVFKDLVKRFPVLHENMVAVLDQYLREVEDRFREVATGRVGPCVALQLLQLLKRIGRPANAEVEIGPPHQELAQKVTTLFTVSRLLSAWDARGVVRPRS
jgi:CRP-like cAMP-binding protein